MINGSKFAALALQAGIFSARADLPPDVREMFARAVPALAELACNPSAASVEADPLGVAPARGRQIQTTAAADDLTEVERFILSRVDRQLGVKAHIVADVRAREQRGEPIGVTNEATLGRLRKLCETHDPAVRARVRARLN